MVRTTRSEDFQINALGTKTENDSDRLLCTLGTSEERLKEHLANGGTEKEFHARETEIISDLYDRMLENIEEIANILNVPLPQDQSSTTPEPL